MQKLLTAFDVDRLLRWPSGRALRMARAGKLPYLESPDGQPRFNRRAVLGLLKPVPAIAGARVADDKLRRLYAKLTTEQRRELLRRLKAQARQKAGAR